MRLTFGSDRTQAWMTKPSLALGSHWMLSLIGFVEWFHLNMIGPRKALQVSLTAYYLFGQLLNGILPSISNFIYSQVMEAKIPVEIGVFCNFIERICGSLIVYNRYRRTGNLHGVTLPRSWLKIILETFQSAEASEKDTSDFCLLLRLLEQLLRTLYYDNSSNPGKIYCLRSNYQCKYAELMRHRNRSLIVRFGVLVGWATAQQHS